MIIISHRGYWKTPEEKNTSVAFRRSFELGFGTETDVRDRDGELVISHDPASADSQTLEDFLKLAEKFNLPLALNIKSDGLAVKLHQLMSGYSGQWFVFDMSVPDMRQHLNAENPVYGRLSDVEPSVPWADECRGIWLDSFSSDWLEGVHIENFLNVYNQVCCVSSELHQRHPATLWEKLLRFKKHDQLMLCTDQPEEARLYFK